MANSLFIFGSPVAMKQAGFDMNTRLHKQNRDVRGVFYADRQLEHELERLRGHRFDMIVLDPSCTPFKMTLVGSQFGEMRSFIEFLVACQGNHPTTWVGNFPAWRQE